MIKKLFIISSLLLLKVEAVLSPTSQAAVEVQRIFSSDEIHQAFGGPDFIVSCEKLDHGYLVKSDESQMVIKVIYEPLERLGPRRFHLEFGQLEPLNG